MSTEVLCSEPETSDGMSVKVFKYSVGGIAQYSCAKGLYMEGNASRECLTKGSWSGKTPVCKRKSCALKLNLWILLIIF